MTTSQDKSLQCEFDVDVIGISEWNILHIGEKTYEKWINWADRFDGSSKQKPGCMLIIIDW